MKENINPCDGCRKEDCFGKKCTVWVSYYKEHQEQINAYARSHGIKPIYIKPTEDPCVTCSLRYVCEEREEICPARAAWWDVCMEKLRGRLGV